MNIIVKVVDLSRELNLLEKIVGKKPTISVLANVLIQAGMGHLTMAATDLEIGLVSGCVADVTEPGAITLPAKKLVEIVRAQTGDTITLTDDTRGAVKFASGKFASRLQALPAKDFVGIPNNDGMATWPIPRQALKQALPQVRYAISDKDTRYFTKGAFFSFDQDTLTVAATDQSRLSVVKMARPGDARDAILVPAKAVDELIALLNEPGDGDVLFAQSERHLFFEVDGRLFISRQVDGKFPAWERIVPKGNDKVATVDRQELIHVLKRMILLDDIVQLSLQAFTLDVSSASADVGEGIERLVVEYDGPSLTLKYQGQYLLDFLSSATSEKVSLAFKDTVTAALLTDGDYMNVVMGMRL